MIPSVPLNATRRLAKDQPEYHQLSVADCVVRGNPEIESATVGHLMLQGEVPAMQTVWELTPDEVAKIMQGGKIVLTIIGRQHPPVHLYVAEREVPKEGRYVTVTSGMDGYCAVVVGSAMGADEFDIIQTGVGRYDTPGEAKEEAETMANIFGMPYKGYA